MLADTFRRPRAKLLCAFVRSGESCARSSMMRVRAQRLCYGAKGWRIIFHGRLATVSWTTDGILPPAGAAYVSGGLPGRSSRRRRVCTVLLVEDERQGGDHSSRQQHSGEDVQQPSAKRTSAPCLNPASTANKQGEQRSRTGEQVEGEY